jgi:hypothetical protein
MATAKNHGQTVRSFGVVGCAAEHASSFREWIDESDKSSPLAKLSLQIWSNRFLLEMQ